MKKLILPGFGWIFGTLRFDEKSFYSTLMGLTPCWDYKPTNAIHADSRGVYTGQKIINLSTINNFHSKCDVIDGSVVNGSRQPILCSFVLDKPPRSKVFCEPGAIHSKKSVLNTIAFYLEDDNNEVNFKEEKLIFSLQLIKIWNNEWALKNLKLFLFVLAVDIDLLQQTFLVIWLLKVGKF